MAELFRFRCFRCQKLLGAPPSKFGKTIQCPRCTAELVVPTPGEEVEAETDEPGEEHAFALNLDDLGSGLRPLPGRRTPAPSSSLRDPRFDDGGANPVAFLENVPAPAPVAAAPATSADENEPDAVANPVVVDLAPRVSPVTGRKPIAITADASDLPSRRRDVVLPRTVVLAWALGALLGTGSAFLAGLMIGHFVW